MKMSSVYEPGGDDDGRKHEGDEHEGLDERAAPEREARERPRERQAGQQREAGRDRRLPEREPGDLAGRGGYGLGSGRVDQDYQVGDMSVTSNVPVSGSLLTGGALIGVTGWVP